MTAFLVECPACSCRIPVDSDTMRTVGPTDATQFAAAVLLSHDRCRDLSCTCNQEPA